MSAENTVTDKIMCILRNNTSGVIKFIISCILFIVEIILIKDENTIFWNVFVFISPTLADYFGLIRKFPDEINAPNFKKILLAMLLICSLFFSSAIVLLAIKSYIEQDLSLWMQFFKYTLFLYPVASCHLLIGDIIINDNISKRLEDSQDKNKS